MKPKTVKPKKFYPAIYISDAALAARLAVSRSAIWRWVQEGNFPEPVKLTKGCTRWKISEIEDWEKRGYSA